MVTDNEQPVNPPGPAEYEQAGFRILPIASDGSKRPLCGAGFFGKDQPEATVPAAQWPPGAGVALLCGPITRWTDDGGDGDWLACIDIDGDSTLYQLDQFVGEALPPTLTSKGVRHLYYRVRPGEARDALRQWAPLFGRKTDGAPKVDLKWSGGYAIEPHGAWDDGWDPEAIAVLPESWIRKVLAIRNARPATPATAPAKPGARVELGELPVDALALLAEVWPGPGEGCHEAALALGGVLGGSDWTDDAICAFAGALYESTGTKDRTSDVLYSANTKRNGGEAKGWPTLKALLEANRPVEQVRNALAQLRASVPGLAAPRPFVPELDDQGRAVPQGAKADLKLNIGSDDEIATKVVASKCPGAVYDEGALWEYNGTRGVWVQIPEHILSGWIEVYDGAVYDYTDKGRPIWVKLGAGRVSSIRQRIEAKRTTPGFFSAAPTGLAFQNGFLALGRGGSRTFGPLQEHHRARWTLPCDFGLDAARRTPPVNWVRYLRSIWGNDHEAIDLVHQILGYLLSGRHDYQKIFVLLGPPRAGKGTLLNLIQAIFRDQATSFKVASLDQTFSLQSMLGKSVAYDPDVRRASSMFKSEGQMVERLLSLSSADTQVVPRKNTTDVVTKLPCRLLLAANPPFGLTDVGGALASRFVILTFPRSFLGSEDRDLGARLAAEIPAIVALALDGLDRLDRVGCFVEPASSAEERASIERAQNPMVAFLEECTETGDYSVGCGEMYAAVTKWRDENGHKRMSNQAFSEFMRQRGYHQSRLGSDGSRTRVYRGIRVRPVGQPNLTLLKGGG